MRPIEKIMQLCETHRKETTQMPPCEFSILLDEIHDLADEEKKDLVWLDCLNAAGVDNWPGCEYAAEMMREEYGDDW